MTTVESPINLKNWIEENATGRKSFESTRERERDQKLEKVGAELRRMMPFLDPVTIKPGD